jgi:hypothetical protein
MAAQRIAAVALTLLLVGSAPGAEQEAINKAIERGVTALKRMQGSTGTWPYRDIGATALAGLTLLECRVAIDDPAIVKAATAVRRESVKLTHSYSVALTLLFLDRLGDARDVPLIESLAVRLLAGQAADGTWDYQCPPISDAEVRRLSGLLRQRNELKGGRTLPKPAKRTIRALPREIQQQLAVIARLQGAGAAPRGGDNSNTQFAILALWVAHRHGLPVEGALRRTEAHFRLSQNSDGGWGYMPWRGKGLPRVPLGGRIPNVSSLATMTCAGVLSLAVGQAVRGEPKPGRDRPLNVALLALGSAIGETRPGVPMPRISDANGKAYYFLWSLERVAVALNLKTIGKKDWYGWGADVLLANQRPDGSWSGEYGAYGADTCFALLFLKRANLASDLTARLGKVNDPAELRGGGVGGAALTERKSLRPALAPEDKDSASADSRPKESGKLAPIPVEVENAAAARLSDALVRAAGAEQEKVLRKLRDSKGVDYTEALLLALPRLEGDPSKQARAALVQRFTRLTARSLRNYLKDVNAEVRRAAALASAERNLREHLPLLIDRLADAEPAVRRAAHAGLRAMTRKDFGPAGDTLAERDKAIAAWREWWGKEGKE